ncbi:MAG: hypothetical protein INR73_02905 [Williamsia sp.]|nr:hypothetical protein [Williamsia sp.]
MNIRGHYYFIRRVPNYLRQYDPRKEVKASLFTDSKKEAFKLAVLHNEKLETYWRNLVTEQKPHCPDTFKSIFMNNRIAGFIADKREQETIPAANAVSIVSKTGGITIADGLVRFWDFAKPKIMNKSPNQIRKWRNPRKSAINNLIHCIGDKPMQEVTRADILKFRDWWIDRIQEESLGPNAANKNFVQAKTIFEVVNDNLDLGIDVKTLFRKLLLEENFETTRRPFESDHICNVLLNPKNLTGLNEQLKWMLYSIAETGAGIAEQISLQPENIHLDGDVPYIEITPKHQKALKTRYRKRTIPLVGFALDAFKACPNGFTEFQDKPDGVSGVLNKYLRDQGLFPTKYHSVYSLRHSFQDRLLAANAPDRVQADLMGHKFNRQAYGNGASLMQKLEWLGIIKLKNNVAQLNSSD